MGDFKRTNNFSNKKSFGKRDFRPGRSGDRPVFDAVCSKCGKECKLPFKPSEDRPVFCSDCFAKTRGETDSRNQGDRNFRKPSFENRSSDYPQYKEQFSALHLKLDKILSLLNASQKPIEISPVTEEKKIIPIVEKVRKSAKKSSPKPKIL